MQFPFDDEERLADLEKRFATRWGGRAHFVYRGVVGAIDGLIVKVRRPSCKAHSTPQAFFCGRYHCFGIAYQCIVDGDCKFMWAFGNAPGSVHDSVAFKSSALYGQLSSGAMPARFFLVGDAAYSDEPFLLTPWPTPRCGPIPADKDTFNWIHSTYRQNVERAFGMLVGRWLILEHELKVPTSRVHSVVTACMLLQNVCIALNQQAPTDDGTRPCERLRPGASIRQFGQQAPRVLLASAPATQQFAGIRSRATGEHRVRVTAALAQRGILRPLGA